MSEKVSMRFRVWYSGDCWHWDVTTAYGRRLDGSGDTSVTRYSSRPTALKAAKDYIRNNNGTIDDYE